MTDLCGVILVRGKLPGEDMLKEAAQNKLRLCRQNIHCLKPAGFFIVMA